MRIIFMGTPDFACPVLSEIVGQGHEVVACYTRAPKPAGRRGLELTPSPVQVVAERFHIPVLTPKSLRSEEAAEHFRAHDADVAVVVAYGLILPKAILDAPRLGCLNLHGSLLPRWRGAAPIQRAIMAGDTVTGVMVMRMDEGLDTGPIGMAEKIAITPEMNARDLHDRMATIGADLMARALGALSRGSLHFQPQAEDGVTYAAKIDKGETRIDWAKPAPDVHNHIRGLTPFPGAWFEMDSGKGPERIKVLRAHLGARASGAGAGGTPAVPGTTLDGNLMIACGTGAIQLAEIQRAGKAPMQVADFLRGTPVAAGAKLN
ncbi:methionyl-tRNA formyltransferase [Methylovirgula sp. 4M-Z18]|uniref:methionyl-tRNA formyltransferase n=1 Tax=Methylovirgula sp. 4M-Z18 TaxID=2293567 RepID=UPI0018F398C4|nr:methionyl-tRNA formyltransferase [Methylovirgula sp. 4M-Z18]